MDRDFRRGPHLAVLHSPGPQGLAARLDLGSVIAHAARALRRAAAVGRLRPAQGRSGHRRLQQCQRRAVGKRARVEVCDTRSEGSRAEQAVSGRRRSPDKAKKQGTPILQGCCETETRFGFALFF